MSGKVVVDYIYWSGFTGFSCVGFVAPLRLAAMNGPVDVAVSEDGKRIYVAAEFSDSLLVFDRDAETGEVTEHSAMGVRYVPLCDASYQLANA